MAKAKKEKPKSVPNRHLHVRASYLYQASTYLQAYHLPGPEADALKITNGKYEKLDHGQRVHVEKRQTNTLLDDSSSRTLSSHGNQVVGNLRNHRSYTDALKGATFGQQRLFMSHIQTITRKSKIHLSQELKRSICKRCDTLLTDGLTCVSLIENESKGGRKSWADTLAVACLTCGNVRRFPIGARPQPPKQVRLRQNFWINSGRSEVIGRPLVKAMACRRMD